MRESFEIEPEPGKADRLRVDLVLPSADLRAPCLFYLHGFGSSRLGEKADRFERKALEAGLGFCSFDFRGHGDSAGSMSDLSISRTLVDADAVHGELLARGFDRLVVVGSSMGGLCGLWHAARRPDGIEATVCIAPAIDLGDSLETLLGAEKMERWQVDGHARIENELGAWSIGYGFVLDLDAHPASELAASTTRPTLIFQGMLDDRVGWRAVAEFAAVAGGGVELHLFANGDHRLVDRVDEIWASTLAFLRHRGVG